MKTPYLVLLCLALVMASAAWIASSSASASLLAPSRLVVSSWPQNSVAAGSPVESSGEEVSSTEGSTADSAATAQPLELAGASGGASGNSCHTFVQRYLAKRGGALSAEQDPSKMLFFLHVPRTAGKTYFTCFLKAATPPSKRCVRSYDLLRLNISAPGCTLLSSHDDMSISDAFPPGAAVITQLRKPEDRVLSAYEFSVDVAARHVHLPDGDKVFGHSPSNSSLVSTLNVWPWSYLVPWFRRDMRARMEKLNKEAQQDTSGRPRWLSFQDSLNRTYYWSAETNKSVWMLPDPKQTLDPYSNPLVTPLEEWIELPVARELVHNTAALQILGLTNYSWWGEAAEGRACLRADLATREALLGVAMRRLVGMKHVGLTERLDESVLSLAASLGIKLGGPSYKHTPAQAFSYDNPALDESQPITYNSSIHYANVTVTLTVARQRLVWLSARKANLTSELRELVPRLGRLLEKEEDWLDEQEAEGDKGGVAADGAEGEEGAGEASGGEGSGGGKEEGAGGKAGAAVGGDGVDGGASKEPVRRAVKSSLRAKPRTKGRREQVPPHPDAAGAAGGSGTDAQDQAQQQHIDSPWAAEIEELDERVSGMQAEMKRLDWDIWSIQHSGVITNSEQAKGRARQILPDELFLQNGTLEGSYKHCTSRTGRRHSAARRKVLKHLVTPWHESFSFSKESRARIPKRILDRIRQLNHLDAQLWELGERLLTAKVAEQQAAGVLEVLDRSPPPTHSRHKRPGRGLESSGSEEAEEGWSGEGEGEGGEGVWVEVGDSSDSGAGEQAGGSSSGDSSGDALDPEVDSEAALKEEL